MMVDVSFRHFTVILGASRDWELGGSYPDAAWSPRPRDPPLTTATLPLRLKMLLKSCSWTSDSAELMVGNASCV
jgi:hypothetical protein